MMAKDDLPKGPDMVLRDVRDSLSKVMLTGSNQQGLALCISVIGEIERNLRKLRVDVLKAIVEGAKQGALPL